MVDEHTMFHAAARPIDEWLAPGTELGRHRIVARLAEGTHAILYSGEHVHTRAEVAIKVLRSSFARSPEMLARFDREAIVMGRLAGARTVVQVHDAGALPDGRRYLVMELVRGRELAVIVQTSVRRGVPLELERIVAIAADIAAGLRDAHAKSVVHRDLAPANVMIVREPDGRETAKLVDFGLSGDRDQVAGTGDLTMMGAVIGTPEYMSPEQAVGLPAAAGMDLFALGVVVFELVTGTLPPRGALRGGSVPPVSSLRTGVPAELDKLIRDLLAVDPKQRPEDAIAVLTRLSTVREQLRGKSGPNAWAEGRPVRAAGAIDLAAANEPMPRATTEVAAVPPAPRRPRRKPRTALRIAIAISTCALAVALGIGSVLWIREPSPREPDAIGRGLAAATAELVPAALPVPIEVTPAPVIEPREVEAIEPPPQVRPRERVRRRSSVATQAAAEPGECVVERAAAEEASTALRWTAVLEHTRRPACWPDARARRRLRVEALAELGRFESCVREGAGPIDDATARIVALCTKRIDEE